MKTYTKTGDKGKTSLIGGKRVLKSDLRINTYGTIDELISFTGYLAAHNIDSSSRTLLIEIQNILFTAGSNLAMDPDSDKFTITPVTAEHINFIETGIDYMEKELKPLKDFILPGGDPIVGLAHICRTVCRRGERLVVELSQTETVDEKIGTFLNRLSDLFFVLARKLMKDLQVEPVIWKP